MGYTRNQECRRFIIRFQPSSWRDCRKIVENVDFQGSSSIIDDFIDDKIDDSDHSMEDLDLESNLDDSDEDKNNNDTEIVDSDNDDL